MVRIIARASGRRILPFGAIDIYVYDIVFNAGGLEWIVYNKLQEEHKAPQMRGHVSQEAADSAKQLFDQAVEHYREYGFV